MAIGQKSSPHVELARRVVESYVRGEDPPTLDDVPDELRKTRAGVFVTIKKRGELRGCIGTIAPIQNSIAEEIRENAISSATRDPRFPPITPDELPELTYSVDVLEESEDIESIEELDPKIYGVIVSSGYRQGLLLPDLEGVDTPEQQVKIAMMKAGIYPGESFRLKRFRVTRHN
ncbi:MAG: AmmeMemoRadiSam system protein A [Actinomycetota bacterium]|nr:AmmeMemoRadiSam system protein A [Actinomycetota bacterium]